MTPTESIRERLARIESGELPIPEKRNDETDAEYLQRLIEQRRKECT